MFLHFKLNSSNNVSKGYWAFLTGRHLKNSYEDKLLLDLNYSLYTP